MEAVTGLDRNYVLDCHWVKQVAGGERGRQFPFHFATWALRRGKKAQSISHRSRRQKRKSAQSEAEPLPTEGREQPGNAFLPRGQLHLLYLGSVSWRQCLCRIHPGNSWEFPPTSSPPNGCKRLFTLTASVFAFGFRIPC